VIRLTSKHTAVGSRVRRTYQRPYAMCCKVRAARRCFEYMHANDPKVDYQCATTLLFYLIYSVHHIHNIYEVSIRTVCDFCLVFNANLFFNE